MGSIAAASPVIDRTWAQFRREIVVETFGLFWIAAEIAILFCMGVAARVFGERPTPQHLVLTPAERRQFWLWCALLATLALLVFGRHAYLAPLPIALERIANAGDNVVSLSRAAFLDRAELHAIVWCAFIAAWVIIEIAIVAQGVRAFGRLRALAGEARRAA